MTLYRNYFTDLLQGMPANTLVLHESGHAVTAEDLFAASVNLALRLQDSGVKKNDRVILVVKPGIDFLILIYAHMMIGTVISIIDPEMGKDNYKAKLRQFNPHHAFADSRLVLLNEHPVLRYLVHRFNQRIPDFPRIPGCNLFTLGTRLPIFQSHRHLKPNETQLPEPLLFEPAGESEGFLITYTSGTLDEPKGVVHTLKSLRSTIQLLARLLQENNDASLATHLPHFVLLGISAGIRVHLWDNTSGPEQKLAFINNKQISTLFGPPADFVPLIDYLGKTGSVLPACLTNIYLGSAPVYPSFLRRLVNVAGQVRITCLYGMTEHLMVSRIDGREKMNAVGEGDLVGYPFDQVEVESGSDGELYVHSDQQFSGYWNLGASAARHATGDLGRIDEQGRIVLLGRKKDMLIRRNFNIYPGLYEPTINRIPGIREAVMVGIYDQHQADEKVVLAVEVENESSIQEKELLKQLETGPFSIDREALPDQVIFCKLPRSGRQHKVNRRQLSNTIQQTQA